MEEKGLVSIIIPTYNRWRWLAEAIESCLAQNYRPIEIIVVDDGSGNPAAREIALRYTGVIYLFQEHRGSGAARNTGIQQSQGEYIQFLDDDDTLTADSVSEKVAVLQHKPEFDVVYSDLYLMSEDGELLSKYYQSKKRPLPEGDIYQNLLSYNFIPIHAMIWRKDALLRGGGFPTRSVLEDWECVVKVAEKSQFAFVDKPLGCYRLHNQNISSQFDKQVQVFVETQRLIINSERFHQVPKNYRAYILCKYSLKQWIDGDQAIASEFLHKAKTTTPFHPLPWLLSGFMLLGRSFNRWLIRFVWMIRSRQKNFLSSRDYFLKKAGKIR